MEHKQLSAVSLERICFITNSGLVLCSAEHKEPRNGDMDDDFWNQSDLTPEQEEIAGDHLPAVAVAIVIVFLGVAGWVIGKGLGWW